MFNKDSKLEKFKDAETIIGASIKVKGNFQGQGDIVVEGTLEGSLKTDSSIFIGDQAKIMANIESRDCIVNGEIHGNLKIKNYLAIGATAKIYGDIQYNEISIEKGGIVSGQFSILEDHKKGEKNKDDKKEDSPEL